MRAARARIRLPAGGRELLHARERGEHPARVFVIFGEDWGRRPTHAPSVCIGAPWRPGETDWSVLAGVPAHVVLRGTGLAPALERLRTSELIAEIARAAAPVVVHFIAGEDWWPYEAGQAYQVDAAEWLHVERSRPELASLWNAAACADYEARVREYLTTLAGGEESMGAARHGEG
jgi:hypothetical protein